MDLAEFGRMIRHTRKRQGLLQSELAALAGVGTRFVSELENGKAGLEIGRAFRVADCVGLQIQTALKSWQTIRHTHES